MLTPSIAQQQDFISMNAVHLRKRVSRSIEFGISNQTAFNQNIAELWILYHDAGVIWKIRPGLSTELHYRLVRLRNLDNFYENRSLFFHAIKFSESFGRFNISVRNRTQQMVYADHWNDTYRGPRWYVRDRLALRYRLNYFWQPYISAEIFNPLNHPARKGIDQIRYGVGAVYNFSDRNRLDASFQVFSLINRSQDKRFYVLNLNYFILL